MNSTRFDKVKVVILGQGVTRHASQNFLPPCIHTCAATAGALMAMRHEQTHHHS